LHEQVCSSLDKGIVGIQVNNQEMGPCKIPVEAIKGDMLSVPPFLTFGLVGLAAARELRRALK
jgi:hypothetical protein